MLCAMWDLICCFRVAKNGWSAWTVENGSPIKQCYGKQVPVCATVPAGTGMGLVVTAKTIIPLGSQMAKQFILPKELHGHKETYYKISVPVTLLLGEQYVERGQNEE